MVLLNNCRLNVELLSCNLNFSLLKVNSNFKKMGKNKIELREMQSINGSKTINGSNEKIQMKKQLGLLEGVAIILGIIVGSGNYKLFN